jgi:hypothetical protein
LENCRGVERPTPLYAHQTASRGFFEHRVGVDTSSVISDLETESIVPCVGSEDDQTSRSLPGRPAFDLGLEAVVNGVSPEVDQGLVQRLDNPAVEAAIRTLDPDLHLFSEWAGEFHDVPGEASEKGSHWLNLE